MAAAVALAALGEAIREDIRRELEPLQKELEHEKKLRELLEQQLLRFQEEVYRTKEVDGLLEGVKKRAEEGAEASKAESERALRMAQRELEHRIETVREGMQAKPASESEKLRSLAEDVPLLTREIDRKLGTVLVDLDQRLAAARAEAEAAVAEALRSASQHADSGDEQLAELIQVAQAALDSLQVRLHEASQGQGSFEEQLGSRLSALQAALEQKIGMVQLDVDQVRVDFEKRLS